MQKDQGGVVKRKVGAAVSENFVVRPGNQHAKAGARLDTMTDEPTFKQVLSEMEALHDKKNQDYGSDEDPFANVRASEEFGIPAWLGGIVRANDKMTRLKSYARKRELANETVEDSLLDLANYAVIALVLHRQSEAAHGRAKENTMDGV